MNKKNIKEYEDQKENEKKTPEVVEEEVTEETETAETAEENKSETAEAAETEVVEEEKIKTPEDVISDLNKTVAELNDKNLRLQAEYQNYRKRVAKDLMQSRTMGQLDAIEPILTVFDHFNMAVMATETSDNMEAIKTGFKMIDTEFSNAIDDLGIKKVSAKGEKFDPNLHDAMAKEASDEVEEDFVIKQWSYGYKMGERLIRPAKVVVSSGPKKEDEDK